MDAIIPENIADWTKEIIDNLIQYGNIESETLDFKEEISDLSRHICAFANTLGGFIVLGIGEKKDDINKKLTGFKKIGFKNGKEDETGLEIGNYMFSISPIPSYETKHVSDGSVFYSVIKIKNEVSKKPFFLKNTSQCFVRINNSSRPAPRSTIMNLFGSSIEYRRNIENLRSSCILLKESLSNTINYIESISTQDQTRPAPIDLMLIRNSILVTESFLSENNLFGKTTKNTRSEGITTILNSLEQLNAQIQVYNTTTDIGIKDEIRRMILAHDRVLALYLLRAPDFLDKIIAKTEKFLSE